MAKSPAIARRYAVVRLKLGAPPPPPASLNEKNQERFVADWGGHRGLLEVAFVGPQDPNISSP